ncbi:MAG: motility protein A [Candidatus Omnitrophica bacterium]|nr:MAG: Chemotaxis protein PomA [Candidatus Hinthialibacteria bacterium OLB16]MBE7487887.1 motility protein A [bacterium]MBK7495569.1 motility protein A [Candidatus Omnitrophota bacterium]MCE7906892.1 motility protein A [Candidatus Omnitrophica bacterium COP1]MBV6483052.1 Chemotaxis protein PomA [bacterium]
MDTAILIGLLISVGFPVFAVLIEGNPFGFISAHASMIVFGGVLGITILSFPLPKVFNITRILRKLMYPSNQDPLKTVELFMEYSDRARKEGILVLEKIIPEIEDEFMRKAMRLAVDGIDPHVIKETLSTEISFIEERHARCAFIFENIATNGPAFAMIGTLIGMVAMLQHLEDPKAVGPSMAVALLATLYGAMVGYTIGFPIVNRLKERHSEEILNKELVIEGIMAIQEGDNPRIVQQRLMAFLPSSVQVANERE